MPKNSGGLMHPRPAKTTTLTIPVAFTSPQARDEFKWLLEADGSSRASNGWGALLLIGDRVVVKNLGPGAELTLRSTLDQLQRLAETRARQGAELHAASRRELLDAVMEQSRVRAVATRFGTPGD
jgi:D-alanyl-D-alanine dipeptidase